MEGIVTGLLAITRCEAGKQATAREPFEIAGLVDELWQSQADKARGKELGQVLLESGNMNDIAWSYAFPA